MGHLSGPQITVLALWSYGIVLAKTCGLTRVTATLASHFGEKENNLRQRLREWCWDKADKQGKQRVDWAVSQSFGPLLKWVLAYWPAGEKRLALAMDASSLKSLFVVFSISVVYRSSAIPIAWTILPEWQKGSWKEPWLGLFRNLQQTIPSDWQVLVMADRGLYASWLYAAIRSCGFHPFLRINLRSSYRPKGRTQFLPMAQLLPAPGSIWAGQVTCFMTHSIEGTLLACWGSLCKEPWVILTDLPPEQGSAVWYSLRAWIEHGFRDLKRDGWQWQNTRMSDPARAARFWLALAVATLWVLTVGAQADANLPASRLDLLPPSHIARRSKSHSPPPRQLSCFSRGLITILFAFIHQHPIPWASFLPEPWPLKTYP